MSDLVAPSALTDYLGLTAPDAVAQALCDQVQDWLERACSRSDRPFTGEQAARTEVHDATGTCLLFLDYSIGALTSVKLGADVAAPDETLVVNDQTLLAWGVGGRRLVRVDDGTFGVAGVPRYVHVTYDAAADLPDLAALAVKRATAALWGQLGGEGLTAERLGAYSADYAPAAIEADPVWQLALQAFRELHL